MKARTEDWENELWSLIDLGDGINCPLYKSCQHREKSSDCLSKNVEYTDSMHEFLDNDFFILPTSDKKFPKIPKCVASSRIFELVKKLAQNYTDKMGPKEIPVPTDVINNVCFDKSIEVRMVSLKSVHGAVWRLKNGWVIHLNSKDSSARRRFTLYHELFHILAHCNASPVFKKAPYKREGTFNELLADHFSAVMIMPEEIMRKKWPEVKDISKMAVIFDVPEPAMYCGLKHMGLI
jgi:Zn-dependent peptidase ImmA (M78 family)